MKTVQKLISAGFATCAFAAAAMPALSWSTLGTVDPGNSFAAAAAEEEPAPNVIVAALSTLDSHRSR